MGHLKDTLQKVAGKKELIMASLMDPHRGYIEPTGIEAKLDWNKVKNREQLRKILAKLMLRKGKVQKQFLAGELADNEKYYTMDRKKVKDDLSNLYRAEWSVPSADGSYNQQLNVSFPYKPGALDGLKMGKERAKMSRLAND
jgi:hypothetical protein